jgi:hypothetical protein
MSAVGTQKNQACAEGEMVKAKLKWWKWECEQ